MLGGHSGYRDKLVSKACLISELSAGLRDLVSVKVKEQLLILKVNQGPTHIETHGYTQHKHTCVCKIGKGNFCLFMFMYQSKHSVVLFIR